ncbi:uncharacterized protein RJT20DRAFT_70 [Scheffersomyces xylosifermentans]|uniref:uncharacterized protein n=1 Tax=Scheffersomyces xylosifermentans TaxID=1304137 RepID=UPI00315D6AB4
MGAWGAQIFENDSASDFIYGLTKSDEKPLETLIECFHNGIDNEYIESDEGSEIIIGALLVCGFNSRKFIVDKANNEISEYHKKPILDFLEKYQSKWDKDYKSKSYRENLPVEKLALNALSVVNSEKSESYELWAETEYLEEWQTTIEKLAKELKSQLRN